MARLPYIIPYSSSFLGNGFQIPLPIPRCRGNLYEAGRVIDYIHFSLVLHQDRKTALFTAHNIDISQRKSVPRTSWALDHRIPATVQTGPSAFSNNPWDRGHLVRRAAVAWGSRAKAKDASDSTFYYSNAALQHERFNQDEWVNLEDWVLQKAGGASSKLSVFTGPIYTQFDKFERGFRIPSAFWKIVVLLDPTTGGNDLSALGFVMKQNELWDDWNGASTLDLHLYEVGIKEIGIYAGLDFGQLGLVDEFEWRQVRFRDRSRMRLFEIKGPDDIQFNGQRRRQKGITAIRPEMTTKRELNAKTSSPTDEVLPKSPCGCEDTISKEETVENLRVHVNTLSEMIELLLSEEHAISAEAQRNLRSTLRSRFSRIVGGKLAGNSEFLHCACIGNENDWFCSGILISENAILTAAHCAPQITKVYLGGRSINLVDSIGEVIDVERVIVHPDYEPNLIPSHDIAVLILSAPAQTNFVEIATEDEVKVEDNTQLVGFGYDHPTQPVGFGTKRQVDVPISNLNGMSEADITRIEATEGFDNQFEFHAGHKGLGKDSCNGDSGGPAYITVGSQLKLAGITSRAAFSVTQPCGQGGIYTRITPYLDWLHSVLDNESGVQVISSQSSIYISAALPNPKGVDPGNEWIEITNQGATAISLTDYSISDKQGGSHQLTGILSAGNTKRIILPKTSPLKLSNKGDQIILNKGGDIIQNISYMNAGNGEIKHFTAPTTPDLNDNNIPVTLFEGVDPC